jgi:poly-gamma-glutamate capsule biosynthesis protein CapA/YwtB (metallophosphatase superfamily)
MRSRLRIILSGLVIIGLVGGGVWWFAMRPASVDTAKGPKATAKKQATIRLIASGDELPHGAITQEARTASGYDYAPFFKTIKPYFQVADLRFCNQETVSAGEAYGISGYPAFNVSKDFARNLSSVGCNIVSLANNHMYDKGQEGINETLGVWEELKPLALAGVNRTPEEQQKVRYFEHKGVRFAFVAYTEISNTAGFQPFALNMLDETLVTSQLTEARKQADVVLVSVHWGTEYSDGLDNGQDRWSARFAELGADVVIGTGPHVLQPVKLLPRTGGGETIVWYSLGNLLSGQLDVPSLIGGFAVMDIDTATKKVRLSGFLPTYMHYEWTAEQRAADDLAARHNFRIYPLDKAAEPLKKSQNTTTTEAQSERVQKLLNTYTKVPILSSEQYLSHR